MSLDEPLGTLPPNAFQASGGYTLYIILGIIALIIILCIIKLCCKGVNFLDVCWLCQNCCSRSQGKQETNNQNEVIFVNRNNQNLMSSVPLGNFNNEVIVLDCGDQVLTDENIQQFLSQNGTLYGKKSSLQELN